MVSSLNSDARTSRPPLLPHLHTPINTTPVSSSPIDDLATPSSGLINVSATIPEEALSAFYGFVIQMHKRYPVISTKKRRSFVCKHTNYLCDYVPHPDEISSSSVSQTPTQDTQLQNEKAKLHLEERLLEVMNKFDQKEIDTERKLKDTCKRKIQDLEQEMKTAKKTIANKHKFNAGYKIIKQRNQPVVSPSSDNPMSYANLKLKSPGLSGEAHDELEKTIKESYKDIDERYKPLIERHHKITKDRQEILKLSRPYRRIAIEHNTEQNLACVRKTSTITKPVKELIEKVEDVKKQLDKFEYRANNPQLYKSAPTSKIKPFSTENSAQSKSQPAPVKIAPDERSIRMQASEAITKHIFHITDNGLKLPHFIEKLEYERNEICDGTTPLNDIQRTLNFLSKATQLHLDSNPDKQSCELVSRL